MCPECGLLRRALADAEMTIKILKSQFECIRDAVSNLADAVCLTLQANEDSQVKTRTGHSMYPKSGTARDIQNKRIRREK